MPRSRKSRNSKNQVKPEWGKNNPQTKAKNKKMMIIAGVIAVAAVVLGAFLFLGTTLFAVPSASSSPSSSATPSASLSPTSSGTPTPTATPLTSPAGEYSANGVRILLETSMGNITIQLRNDKPITAGNFVNLTNHGIYDNTIFHRVIEGFMIQGGDPTGTGYGDSSIASISDEIGSDNHNYNGTIAMANTGQANSAGSQFFINVADNNNRYSSFDTTYTVFGRVIQGMDVVMAISHVSVDANNNDKPLQNVTLIKAMVLI
jgi:peptidylprolyl isomerase